MAEHVMVTGGAGYIGSHTCQALAAAGMVPVCFDNLCQGHRWAARYGPLVQGELGDGDALRACMRAHDVQAVIHFAADAAVGASMVRPDITYRTNVAGTLALLDAMVDAKVGAAVLSSSCAVYGEPQRTPMDERHPLRPISPYGASKLMAERLLADYARAFGLRAVILRYFNAAGADPRGALGEVHDPESHLVPLALRAAAGGAALTVHGDDYPTPDGTCVRDYVHVSDLADAHVAALRRARAGHHGTYNLGSGAGTSVRGVLEAVQRATGSAVPVRRGPRRPGDPPTLVADIRRAARALDFTPRRSDIDTVVRTAWAWEISRGVRRARP